MRTHSLIKCVIKTILEEETFKKYGYYARNFKPQSHKPVLAACDECGIIRVITKNGYHPLCLSCSKKGRYPSKETRKKMSLAQVGPKHPNWKGGKIKRTCKTCGETFDINPSDIKYGMGKYCSNSCRIKDKLGENSSNWKGGLVKRTCKECGEVFFVKPSRVKGGAKYCSNLCRLKDGKGENHPAWKGGISFEPYCHRFNEEFKQYIRAKFDNVCFLCDKNEEENGQKLSVHHVNYDKNCGCADTEEDKKAEDKSCQFVPLCRSCNSKVNKDRDKWEKYFKNKLRNKLNGWYI